MKKWLPLLLALCVLATLSGALAESAVTEALSVTHHTVQIAGQTLSYTATTGRMMVDMQGSESQMFFTAYIGLKKEAVIRDNLRVYVDDFCAGLLGDRNLTVGYLDGRLTGPVTDGSFSEGGADPSSNTFGTAFGGAINNYFAAELGYQTDLLYVSFAHTPYSEWKYNRDNQALDQKTLIRNAMPRNRFMKVWVLCGYYDLSTPFFAAEWVYDHVFLNPENRENLFFTYYPSGHMIYMHQPSLEQFRKDAEAWYHAG